MRKPKFAPNLWQQRIAELEAKHLQQLNAINEENAELRGRIHQLELLLAQLRTQLAHSTRGDAPGS